MKKYLFYAFYQMLKSNPKLFKKIKLFVFFGVFGTLVVSGAVIWAGYSILTSTAGLVSQTIQAESVQKTVGTIKESVANVQLQPMNCLDQSVKLIAIEPWLAKSIAENLIDLKQACLTTDLEAKKCQSESCDQVDQLNQKQKINDEMI